MFLPAETPILLKQLIKTWKSIEFLNGNLSNLSKFEINNFNKLMFLKSLKHGFKIENLNYSQIKIWDYVLLEKSNDKQLNLIKWTFNKWQKELPLKWQNSSISNQFEFKKNDFIKPIFKKEILSEKDLIYVQKLNHLQNEMDSNFEIDNILYGLYLMAKLLNFEPFNLYNFISSLNFLTQWFVFNEVCKLKNFNLFEEVSNNLKTSNSLQNEYELNQISQNFFIQYLKLIEQSADKYQNKLSKFISYKNALISGIEKYGHKKIIETNLAEIIISNPILSKKKLIDITQCHRHSASHYIDFLEKNGFTIQYLTLKEKITFNKDLFHLIINEE